MRPQAIAICRVSTPEQRLNNSLPRQEESVRRAAEILEVDIVKSWSGDASSKVGKNVKRKDLEAAYVFCKSNRRVKYLIVDEVDRFMRSTAEMFYWIIKFQEIGVKVYFASNPELNEDDAKARLLLSLDGFKAEGSNEERQHKSISGHEKAIREGRYTFPPKPGYMKGTEPGVHLPHPVTYAPLQKAFKEVISGLYTPQEALKRLNASEFATVHAKWRMDKFQQFGADSYYTGIVEKNKQVKERNVAGRHQAMLTVYEQEQLVVVFNGKSKLRGPKKQYNPEFPMNKLLTCEDCGEGVKFTGSMKNNGYAKKTTRYYYKYHCRKCGRGYHRSEVHERVNKRLSEVRYATVNDEFVEALRTVWEQKQADRLAEMKDYEKQRLNLLETKSKLVVSMAQADVRFKEDVEAEIDNVKQQIMELEEKISSSKDLESDLIEFVEFSLNYTQELIDDWWTLDHENRVWCQQLIFPGGISFNSKKKVGTPEISPIFRLASNKKDLKEVSFTYMVELAGTAPASAGLSWLVFYGLSPFDGSRNLADERTKGQTSKSDSLRQTLRTEILAATR